MQHLNQTLVFKATELLKKYDDILEHTASQGDILDEVLNLCKSEREIDAYAKYYSALKFLEVIAKPKVQKILMEDMGEYDLTEFIELLGDLIHFFNQMKGEHFAAKLQLANIEGYSYTYTEADLKTIIDETERNIKATKPIKTLSDAA